MSLTDDLYTKRQFLNDLAQCDAIASAAREACAARQITGLALMELEPKIAQARKLARARWAENARWFGALAKAKREWARKVQGEHDHESLKKLNFLKFVVASLLDGIADVPSPVERSWIPEGTGPLCRERGSKRRAGMVAEFMPECDYEICTGGRWTPVQKQDLPDRVRWV